MQLGNHIPSAGIITALLVVVGGVSNAMSMLGLKWTLFGKSDEEEDDDFILQVPMRFNRRDAKALVAFAVSSGSNLAPSYAIPIAQDPVSAARWLLMMERKRQRLPGMAGLFSDPAWFIMLDLFVREAEGETTSVTSAVIASGVAPTTGLRYVTMLVRDGKILRRAHPHDERSSLLSLSDEMRLTLCDFLIDAFDLANPSRVHL